MLSYAEPISKRVLPKRADGGGVAVRKSINFVYALAPKGEDCLAYEPDGYRRRRAALGQFMTSLRYLTSRTTVVSRGCATVLDYLCLGLSKESRFVP
jgi:hypothetical protein